MTIADPQELLQIKEKIIGLWEELPLEHQASMLLVLLNKSEAGDWAVQVHLFKEEQEGESLNLLNW